MRCGTSGPLAGSSSSWRPFCRVIVFDKRGTGLSDPIGVDDLPTVEEWIDDLRAVLDHVGPTGRADDRHRRVADGARLRGHVPGSHVLARWSTVVPGSPGPRTTRGASRSSGSSGDLERIRAGWGTRMAGRWAPRAGPARRPDLAHGVHPLRAPVRQPRDGQGDDRLAVRGRRPPRPALDPDPDAGACAIAERRGSRPSTAGTSPSGSRAHGSSRSPAPTTTRGPAIRRRCCARSRSS